MALQLGRPHNCVFRKSCNCLRNTSSTWPGKWSTPPSTRFMYGCVVLHSASVHDTFLPLWETGNDHKKVWCNALLKPVVRKTAQARHTHGFFLVSYRDGTGVFICLFVNFFELLLFCLARPTHSCQWPKSGTRWGCGHVVIGTCPFLPSNIHARADTLFIILNLSIGPSVLWVLCTVGNASCIFL